VDAPREPPNDDNAEPVTSEQAREQLPAIARELTAAARELAYGQRIEAATRLRVAAVALNRLAARLTKE
jgi:hypothetical protein